jgi:hypothetical protein
MLHPACKIGLTVVACGLLLLPNAMWGQKERPRQVQDEAKLFSEKAIEEANSIIAKIKETHRKDLWIETVEKGPEKAAAAKWAENRFNSAGGDGVYVLITTEPKHFEIVVSPKTRDMGYFTLANRDEVKKILAKNLKDHKDETLLKVAQYTLDVMNEARAKFAPRLVKDDAKLFSADAIKEANGIVVKIKETHQKDLFIETLEEGRDAKESAAWAQKRSDDSAVDGIYVVITVKPKRFETVVGRKTLEGGFFTIADRNELKKTLQSNLGAQSDEALLKVANYTLEAMNKRKKPAQK